MEFGLYGDISILRNPISLPFAILDLLGKSWDYPWRPIYGGYPM